MDMIGKVRRMKLRDQLSLSEIAKRTGLSRNTVKKGLKAPSEAVPKYERVSAPGKLTALSYELPDPAMWTLENLCEVDADGQYPALVQLFEFCETAAYHVSDAIGIRYFTLTSESLSSVGV